MSDEERNEHAGESGADTDAHASPSLSALAERIRARRDRPARDPDDGALREGTDATDLPTTADVFGESEFFFPAADRTPKAGSEPARSTGFDPDATTHDAEATAFGERDDDHPGESEADAFGNDAKAEAIVELLGDARNLLLSGPLSRPADYGLCTNLIAGTDGPPDHLLMVSFRESPDERLDVLRGHLGTLPDDVAMLNVGDATREGSQEAVHTTGGGDITVETVSDATDVQRIGLAVNKRLSEWDGEAVLCFHSLTDLLGAVDSESAFRFCNVLLGRVQAGDVRAHYHIDPDAHDGELLATYRPLFDETLRFEEDGSVRIDR